MTTVDGARSVKVSSEESFQYVYTPCQNDGKSKEAKFCCTDCRDYLCESCESSHKRFRSTRDHTVVLSSELEGAEKHQPIRSHPDTTLCSCNRNVSAEINCRNHVEVFCSECKIMKHRRCETLTVDEMVQELNGDFDESTNQVVCNMKDKIDNFLVERNKDLENFALEADACKREIVSFSVELKEHIDKIEQQTLDNLSK